MGYALIGYPHVAYLLALEWIGKIIVSPISLPFLLGSPEHRAAMLGLGSPSYSAPVILPEGLEWSAGTSHAMHDEAVLFSAAGGIFRKRVRAAAHSVQGFADMHRTYAALAPLLASNAAPTSLPRNVRLAAMRSWLRWN